MEGSCPWTDAAHGCGTARLCHEQEAPEGARGWGRAGLPLALTQQYHFLREVQSNKLPLLRIIF